MHLYASSPFWSAWCSLVPLMLELFLFNGKKLKWLLILYWFFIVGETIHYCACVFVWSARVLILGCSILLIESLFSNGVLCLLVVNCNGLWIVKVFLFPFNLFCFYLLVIPNDKFSVDLPKNRLSWPTWKLDLNHNPTNNCLLFMNNKSYNFIK